MYDIGFVVLNYNLYDETVRCVESIIEHIDSDNYIIIIVDNYSTNGNGRRLSEHYKTSDCVKVIQNESNLGFARGNNAGIKYINNTLGGANYICCLNNDTILDQSNYLKIINSIYENDNSIAVIGVRIYDALFMEYEYKWRLLNIDEYERLIDSYERKHRHPREILSNNPIRRKLLRNKMIYDLNFQRRRIEKQASRRINRTKNTKRYYSNIHESESRIDTVEGDYDIVPHGCCIVFTGSFFEKLSGFDEHTFMYGEEEILFLDVKEHGLNTFKSMDLHIRHIGAESTNAVFSKSKIRKYKMEQNIKSRRILVEKMKKYAEEMRGNDKEYGNL